MDLTRVSTADLVALKKKLEAGHLRAPLTRAGLKDYVHVAESAPAMLGVERDALLGVLSAVLAERRAPRGTVELVWTGPDTVASQTRDTEQVLRALFARAEAHVIVAGYTFDHGEALFEPLKRAMVERGVGATFFVDVPASKPALPAEDAAAATVRAFIADNWPEASAPFPRFYYDPRTVGTAPYLSLHAKCVVVDGSVALVGSANFTNRGMQRNIECGALVEDGAFAGRLARQWMDLVSSGRVLETRI